MSDKIFKVKAKPDPAFFLFFLSFFLIIYGCAGSSFLHRLFSSCEERGLLSSCGVCGLPIAVASLVGTGSRGHRLQQLPHVDAVVEAPGL